MHLTTATAALAADNKAAMSGISARCEAANFRWDDAVSIGRADAYAQDIENPKDHSDWRGQHKDRTLSFVYPARDSLAAPETFLQINNNAHLLEDLDNAYLIRLESLERAKNDVNVREEFQSLWSRFINSPRDLYKGALRDSDLELCADFVDAWNLQLRTQKRPMFATFLADFGGNLESLVKSDWPHRIRDKCGLAHFNPIVGSSIPVVLMCYSLDEVRQQRLAYGNDGSVSSFARPTVLDSEMNEAFVPAPMFDDAESFGYTLDLSVSPSNDPNDFSSELLTYPIEYRASHIKALGFITKPHLLEANSQSMLDSRNRHVHSLRRFDMQQNYGEILT